MSKFNRLFLLFLLFVSLYGQDVTKKSTPQRRYFKILFQNGIRDFRVGSYYDALDEFNYLARFPGTPYYLPSLLMLAKTYLYIGKRTGEKRYFWSALNFLNRYLAKGGEEGSEYYMTKAKIYENLGFYERALSYYKMALNFAKSKKEKIDIVIGILRSAVWMRRLDIATRYMVILSIESLTKKEKKEFEFLQGMYYFDKGDYKKALLFFRKTYRDFENYLIDNPQYYYMVAETAYRLGRLDFARRLFKRILTYTKNKDVRQKSLLRLGDIYFLQKSDKTSAHYYITLVKLYPTSPMATVAKLKLLYLMKRNPKLAYYIKKYMPKADFVLDPDTFVIKTLMTNRANYEGIFALANFGLNVFDLDSPKLFKRLTWELSMVPVQRLKFEHKEYFRRLWTPFLKKEENYRHVCKLYDANPSFFIEVFPFSLVHQIAKDLEKCGKKRRWLALLKRLTKRYHDDRSYLALAQGYYALGQYTKSMEILQKVKKRDCNYFVFLAKVAFLGDLQSSSNYKEPLKKCAKSNFYAKLFLIYHDLERGEIPTDFFKKNSSFFAKNYEKDPVVRKFVQKFAQYLIQREEYAKVVKLLSPLTKDIRNDCFLKSVLALSYIRIGKSVYAKELLQSAQGCENTWYNLAKLSLKDVMLEREIEGL